LVDSKIIHGVYIVEKKFGVMFLIDKINKLEQAVEYFKFEGTLFQSFDEDTIKKIMEALNCGEKLLIDFDKDVVKRIVKEDEPFIKSMTKEFKAQTVQDWLDGVTDNPENSRFINF